MFGLRRILCHRLRLNVLRGGNRASVRRYGGNALTFSDILPSGIHSKVNYSRGKLFEALSKMRSLAILYV